MVSEQIKLFVPCLLCRRASKREGKVQVYYGRIGPDIQRTVWLLNAPHGSALLNSLLQTRKSFTNVRICDYILLAHKLIQFKFSHHLFNGSIWWQHNLIRIDDYVIKSDQNVCHWLRFNYRHNFSHSTAL